MTAAHSLLWIKALLAGGYALYLTIFVINNVSDPLTNSGAVAPMMTMEGLKADPILGRGVTWRAIDSRAIHRAAYWLVIVLQALAGFLLWRATWLLGAAGTSGYSVSDVSHAVGAANLGMFVFLALALLFIVSGLWFVNWVKMAPVQEAHTTLFFVALFGVIVLNLGT